VKQLLAIILLLFFINSCGSVKYNNLYTQNDKIKAKKLERMLLTLSDNKEEASTLATLAITHSKRLANEYNLTSPPLYHNFLVNSGQRQKGLCYDFVDDLMKEINKRDFQSFYFRWGRANANKLNEHNVIVVFGDKESRWEEGVVLDAWRDSGKLFFTKVKDDKKYNFLPWEEGDIRIAK